MTEYARIAQHFATDVAESTMTVRREDGLFRHIEFSALKGMTRVVLITWPYNLLVAGSHGSYHFERFGNDTEDMFDWLRGLRVDPDSWASKLVNGRDSVEEYDRSLMVAAINECVADAIEDDWAPEGLEGAVSEEILGSHLLDTKDTAFQLVSEFEYGMKYRAECSCGLFTDFDAHSSATTWECSKCRSDGKKHESYVYKAGGFDFDGFTEWNVDKVGYHFVYQCHAIVRGIAQYDAARKSAEVVA
ncbi:hypothetical protein [Streptomyces violaceusniger]|uniref:hypothetical protein n=1 Tax=Streptomyces violaceusniger TaxID=68280 RepID=UPI0036CB4F7D